MRDAPGEPPSAAGDEDRVETADLLGELEPGRARPGHDVRMVVGVDRGGPGPVAELLARGERVGVDVAHLVDGRTVAFEQCDLGRRRDRGHEDRRPVAVHARRPGDGDAVVAAGRRDDPGLRDRVRHHEVGGAPRLERARMLEVLEFQPRTIRRVDTEVATRDLDHGRAAQERGQRRRAAAATSITPGADPGHDVGRAHPRSPARRPRPDPGGCLLGSGICSSTGRVP